MRFLQERPQAGANTCSRTGAALRVGQRVFERGIALRPIEIGILAEIGHAVVHVQPRPRSPCCPPATSSSRSNERPAAGQIRNSNGPMLAAAIARDGGAATELPVARDEPGELDG